MTMLNSKKDKSFLLTGTSTPCGTILVCRIVSSFLQTSSLFFASSFRLKAFSCLLFVLSIIPLKAQENTFIRSSLHMVLIDDFNFENAEAVLASYEKFPFPENYNDHRIDFNKVKLEDYLLTEDEELSYGVKKSLAAEVLSESTTDASEGIIQDNSKVHYQLMKFIDQKKLAHEFLRKWYNIKEDGSFDQDYILKMLNIQLTKEQKLQAIASGSEGSEKDKSIIRLVGNTFLVFTRMNYVSNEVVASAIREKAYEAIAKNKDMSDLARTLAKGAADVVYKKTSEGYSVWTNAWLFQLVWNEEIKSQFYDTYNRATEHLDMDKFYELPLELEFLGNQKATSLVTFSLRKGEGNRTEEEVFDLSTIRNMDKVLVKLQKKHDVFKPIFPIQSIDPIGAYLGKKEGINGGERFEILKKNQDEEFERIGVVKVDKKKVWDNRYGSDQEEGMTYFKGKVKRAQIGMLIRQIK